ncbi:hypothetical protein LSAT2_029963 [Lamellibrachia satsuma]|nr:hypothetical protein LSAT2_029963 [Lamellibrachia satsuma]
MSGHIFGGPTPTNGAETQWYTTNSEYGRSVLQTKPTTAGAPSYKPRPFYIAPQAKLKLPAADPSAHAQAPVPVQGNERRTDVDARKYLTTGPAKQFMQNEMGRFWENIQDTTDSAGAARAVARAPDTEGPTAPAVPPAPVAAGAAGQDQVSAGHSDILTITRDDGGAEFNTRADDDTFSHSVPSTASSGNGTLAPPTGQAQHAEQAKT